MSYIKSFMYDDETGDINEISDDIYDVDESNDRQWLEEQEEKEQEEIREWLDSQ